MRTIGKSLRRYVLYQIVLLPGMFLPAGAGLEALGMTSPTTLAGVLTALVALWGAFARREALWQPFIAYSLFSLFSFLAADFILTMAGGGTTTVGALLVSALSVPGGLLGTYLARDGRLDGFARAAQAGPRR